jgi:hypothetical protein
MFKKDDFTIFDWIVFSILIWIPGINILVALLFIIKKGFLFTLKKVILVYAIGIIITLLLLAIFGLNI